MIIHNRETNSLKLVDKVDLHGPLDLFWRSFSASTGYSLEVFRDERHLASITPANTGRRDLHTLALANLALRINLGPRIMTMSGQFHTLDGFTPRYELELRIHVSSPTQFAALYSQHSDPVALAQRAVESIFASYAQSRRHDQISTNSLTQIAHSSLADPVQQQSGIAVDEVMRIVLFLDPEHGQIQNFSREEMVERARLQKEGNLAHVEQDIQMPLQHRRDEHEAERQRRLIEHQHLQDALQKQHDLEMNRLDRQHARQQALQDVFAQGVSQTIANHLNNGYSLQELWNQYPELRGVLESSVQLQIEGAQGGGPVRGEQRALPPARSGRTDEQSGFRAKARRRIEEDRGHEIIEMEASPTPGADVVYEPIIKVKQRRAGSPDALEDTLLASSSPAQGAPTVPIVSQTAATISATDPSATIPLVLGTSFHNTRLGATLTVVSEDERRALQLDEQIVFSVQAVDAGGPAQRAAMMRSDFLVEINRQPITDIQSLLSHLDGCTDDAPITIRVLRMGQLINLPAVPMSRPQ